MWDFILDFKQREILKYRLTNDDLHVLFYIQKTIIDEEFLVKTEPTLFKDILYKDILEAQQNFYFETKQLKRLIDKLNNAGYIKSQKIYAGIKVRLTFKLFDCLSPKQFNSPDNQKYFFLLKWTKMSISNKQSGQKCPSFTDYYNNIITKYNNSNIYNNSINTEEDNSINNNIVYGNLLPLFQKYPNFKTNYLKGLNIPSYFNCQKLINAIDNSYYLREKATLKFIIDNYDKAIRGDYKGENKESIVQDAKNVAIQESLFRDYSKGKDLLEDMP